MRLFGYIFHRKEYSNAKEAFSDEQIAFALRQVDGELTVGGFVSLSVDNHEERLDCLYSQLSVVSW